MKGRRIRMKNERKPVKEGLDFIRNSDWNPVERTRDGVIRLGWRLRDAIARKFGFVPVVCDCGDYFRLSFARPESRRRMNESW